MRDVFMIHNVMVMWYNAVC